MKSSGNILVFLAWGALGAGVGIVLFFLALVAVYSLGGRPEATSHMLLGGYFLKFIYFLPLLGALVGIFKGWRVLSEEE